MIKIVIGGLLTAYKRYRQRRRAREIQRIDRRFERMRREGR